MRRRTPAGWHNRLRGQICECGNEATVKGTHRRRKGISFPVVVTCPLQSCCASRPGAVTSGSSKDVGPALPVTLQGDLGAKTSSVWLDFTSLGEQSGSVFLDPWESPGIFQDHRTGVFGFEGAVATTFLCPHLGEHPCYFPCDQRLLRVRRDLAVSQGRSCLRWASFCTHGLRPPE